MSSAEQDKSRAVVGSKEWWRKYELIQLYRRNQSSLAGLAEAMGKVQERQGKPSRKIKTEFI